SLHFSRDSRACADHYRHGADRLSSFESGEAGNGHVWLRYPVSLPRPGQRAGAAWHWHALAMAQLWRHKDLAAGTVLFSNGNCCDSKTVKAAVSLRMGMSQVVKCSNGVPEWPRVAAWLAERGIPVQLRMIDGQLALPEDSPGPDWRELRVGTAA